jgi:hypothetical protein
MIRHKGSVPPLLLLGVLYFARIGAMLAAIPSACAIGVWSSWEHDNGALREKAVAVTVG